MKGKSKKEHGEKKMHAEHKEKEMEKAEHKAKKHGKAHKVEGHKEKMRLDKKARGGKIATPKSPLSGAEPKGLPGSGKGENAPKDKSSD